MESNPGDDGLAEDDFSTNSSGAADVAADNSPTGAANVADTEKPADKPPTGAANAAAADNSPTGADNAAAADNSPTGAESAAATDKVREPESKDEKEKKRLSKALLECDKRIQKFENCLLKLHDGEVSFMPGCLPACLLCCLYLLVVTASCCLF